MFFWLLCIVEWKQIYFFIVFLIEGFFFFQEVLLVVCELVLYVIVIMDVGQYQMWVVQYLCNGFWGWISSVGFGIMGFGMLVVMGVQVVCFDCQVVCIVGDVSILMNIQELGILVVYGFLVKVVIVNNYWQGMVCQWQESFYEECYLVFDMFNGMFDFVVFVCFFGVDGVYICEWELLKCDFEVVFKVFGLMLIDIYVCCGENCYLMVFLGKSNVEMVGFLVFMLVFNVLIF